MLSWLIKNFISQQESESDDEFKLDINDDDDQSDTTSKTTSENAYVPLKERRRQQVRLIEIIDKFLSDIFLASTSFWWYE